MFSPESKFMQGLSLLMDGIWLSCLMVLTSIPIVTIGASLVAGYQVAHEDIAGIGKLTNNYCKAVKASFIKATLIWVCMGICLFFLVCSWLFLRINLLLIIKIALTLLWLIEFQWVWFLQYKFGKSAFRTMFIALIIGVSYSGWTLILILIDFVCFALLIASWMYFPQGLLLLLILGYGVIVMVREPVMERAIDLSRAE